MRTGVIRIALFALTTMLVLSAGLPQAHAIHFYRGTGGGCSAAEGALTDDPEGTTADVTATVVVGHNTFSSGISGLSVTTPVETHIKAGESIRWTWNSSHCHSVTSTDFVTDPTRIFDSGFHYPTTPPESPQVVPGFFEYPLLDETPTLDFTHTFTTPGTYSYFCVHHTSIGMNGVVVVEP